MHLRSVDILAKDGFILAGIFHITLKRPCYVKKKKRFSQNDQKKKFFTCLVGEEVHLFALLIMKHTHAWSSQVLLNRQFYTQNINSHFISTLFSSHV